MEIRRATTDDVRAVAWLACLLWPYHTLLEMEEEMEKFLGCRVNLQCWVKVKEGWRNRDSIIWMLGFVKE